MSFLAISIRHFDFLAISIRDFEYLQTNIPVDYVGVAAVSLMEDNKIITKTFYLIFSLTESYCWLVQFDVRQKKIIT
jgi:hypothetical protein